MSYFIDSGVWIAAFNKRDVNHEKAKLIINNVSEGKLSKIVISDYIYDEVLTYLRKKIGSNASNEIAQIMLESPHISIQYIDNTSFNASYHIFRLYEQLSFTDASTVVLIRNQGIQYLLSFDTDFDGIKGIIRLTEPLTGQQASQK